MKRPVFVLVLTGLLVATACASAVRPAPRARILQPTPLYILHNPGKDGEIWSVGYGPESLADFNQRVRVYNQDEAEKAIALTIDAAPARFTFAGLVRI